MVDSPQKDLEKKLDTHFSVLPRGQILVVVWCLMVGAILTMSDTTGISVALPYIAKDLNAAKTIQWAGTVFSISNAIFTVLSGRFADIFGRRNLVIACLVTTGTFQLAQGLARTGPQFYIFRAISGLGCGGVIPLSMVIISDIVKPHERAKYQGLLGSGIGLGSVVGFFMFGGFAERKEEGWRDTFYLLCPISIATAIVVWYIVPNSKSELSKREIWLNLDYLGIFTAAGFIIFFLIPLNCGMVLYKWSSPLIITFFVLAGVFFIAFVLIEAYVARLPIIPHTIFNNIPVCNILFQACVYGMVFFSVTFYLPLYFTVVRGFGTMRTSGIMQCIMAPLCVQSNISGRIISGIRNYNYVIWTGYSAWVLANFLLLTLNENRSLWAVCLILVLMGNGIGWTFQPTQQALQSQSRIKDRAVIMALRNALRFLGNAIGIALSSLIFTQAVIHGVETSDILTQFEKDFILSHITAKFHIDTITSDPIVAEHIKSIYMVAVKHLIYLWIPAIAVCWLLSFLIKDTGLSSKDEPEDKKGSDSVETNPSSVELQQSNGQKARLEVDPEKQEFSEPTTFKKSSNAIDKDMV